MLTTPLAPLTGRTPPSSARPGYCPRRQDASWLARWRSWTGCYTVLNGHLWPCSAGPRYPTSSV